MANDADDATLAEQTNPTPPWCGPRMIDPSTGGYTEYALNDETTRWPCDRCGSGVDEVCRLACACAWCAPKASS